MKKVLALLLLSLFLAPAYAKDYDADIVIVGAGWSGLVAAVAAGEAGLQTVVLEKAPVTGGSGVYLLGTTATGSTTEYTTDKGYTDYMAFTHYAANGGVVRALFKETPNNIKWLKDHGVKFIEGVGEGRVAPFADDMGADVVKNFNARIAKMANVTVLTETPAKHLIVENGIVNGFNAENVGETIRVNSKHTVLATGPIISSPEMVKKYAPYLGEGYRVIGAPGRTGDGINLALEAGAKIDTSVALDTEAAHTMGHNDYRIINRDLEMLTLHILVKTPLLRVNYLGNRFMDESINAFHMEAHSLARNKNMYWVIFDEEIKNALINRGVDELGFPRPIFPMLPDPKLKNLNSALEKAYAKGYAVKANTVDELAKKIGVDPANLKATVARQNELAKQRKDDDYLKNPKFLHNYAKGPFYALKGEHTIISTNGGVQCNEDFQVINENLKPIPGLYVTGVLIGSMVGDTYPMHAAGGTSCGFGVAASRVIVQNIAAQK